MTKYLCYIKEQDLPNAYTVFLLGILGVLSLLCSREMTVPSRTEVVASFSGKIGQLDGSSMDGPTDKSETSWTKIQRRVW